MGRDCLSCHSRTGANHEVGQQSTHRIICRDGDRVGHRPCSTSSLLCRNRTCLEDHMRHRGTHRVGRWGRHGAIRR